MSKEEPSVAARLVRLLVEHPCAGMEGNFELHMSEVICQRSYDIIVANIEFRRKCMNQGFDNLLELLKMHYDALREASGTKKDTDRGEP